MTAANSLCQLVTNAKICYWCWESHLAKDDSAWWRIPLLQMLNFTTFGKRRFGFLTTFLIYVLGGGGVKASFRFQKDRHDNSIHIILMPLMSMPGIDGYISARCLIRTLNWFKVPGRSNICSCLLKLNWDHTKWDRDKFKDAQKAQIFYRWDVIQGKYVWIWIANTEIVDKKTHFNWKFGPFGQQFINE